MYNLEIIPFTNFKQKISLLKEISHKGCSIEVFNNFICVEKFNLRVRDGVTYDNRYAK